MSKNYNLILTAHWPDTVVMRATDEQLLDIIEMIKNFLITRDEQSMKNSSNKISFSLSHIDMDKINRNRLDRQNADIKRVFMGIK